MESTVVYRHCWFFMSWFTLSMFFLLSHSISNKPNKKKHPKKFHHFLLTVIIIYLILLLHTLYLHLYYKKIIFFFYFLAIKFRAANTIQRWYRGCYARRGTIARKRVKYIKKLEVQNVAAVKITNMCIMHRSRTLKCISSWESISFVSLY